MPKSAKSSTTKITAIMAGYPDEFLRTPADQLFCQLCQCNVWFEKRHYVDVHHQSKQHQKSACLSSSISRQTFLPPPSSTTFTDQVVKAFLAADIPLYKLRNSEMIKLFYSIGNPLPSETTCRRINDLADEELERIKSLLTEDVFMVIDESELRGLRYLNVLVGSMDHPQVAYLISATWLLTLCTSSVLMCHRPSTRNCSQHSVHLSLWSAAFQCWKSY